MKYKMANLIDKSLTDISLLEAIGKAYSIECENPITRFTLKDKLGLARFELEEANELLEKAGRDPRKQTDAYSKIRVYTRYTEEIEKEIKESVNEEIKYFPLTKKTTFAYIMGKDELIPIGWDRKRSMIIYEEKAGSTFKEVGLPESPTLWVHSGNRICIAL